MYFAALAWQNASVRRSAKYASGRKSRQLKKNKKAILLFHLRIVKVEYVFDYRQSTLICSFFLLSVLKQKTLRP